MRKDKIIKKLPNPFIFNNGKTVNSIADWDERRNEILQDVINLEYGGMPPKPDCLWVESLTQSIKGGAPTYRVHNIINGYDFTFCFTAFRPNVDEKTPVVITGDSMYYKNLDNAVIENANSRGFTVIKFNRCEFAPDLYNSDRISGIYPLYKDLKFSAISAWAWGYHRVIDAITTFDYIDLNNIAITGHSRGGKAVLLAGATDTRVKYVNPNNSGAHGCGSYLFEQNEEFPINGDVRNEKLADLFSSVPYLMGQDMKKYIGSEVDLKHDMHFIKALVAPRILLETNGLGDIWSNPRGSYLTHLASKEVWKFLNAEENCLTYYREGGHKHGYEDFMVLFNLIENTIKNKTTVYPIPFNDIEPIHDYLAPTNND